MVLAEKILAKVFDGGGHMSDMMSKGQFTYLARRANYRFSDKTRRKNHSFFIENHTKINYINNRI